MHKYLIALALFLLFGVCAQRTNAQTPNFTGSFEVVDCIFISGWDRNEGHFNPFGKMAGITTPDGTGVTVTISGPPSGRADDPFRTVGIKSGFSFSNGSGIGLFPPGAATCIAGETIPRPFDTGKITSITLEGPDDKQPQDAFFDLNLPTFQLKPIRIRPSIPRP